MNRNHNRPKRGKRTIQVWTYEQVRSAQGYLGAVLRSLREGRLEAVRHQLRARRLEREPGRPNTSAILALEGARREAALAVDRFQESLQELHALDVYSLDPVNGLALVPFVHDEQLAWFVFDLFDTDPIRFWRFHADPLDTRRPVTEAQQRSGGSDMVA
jgi:hypothetical protein